MVILSEKTRFITFLRSDDKITHMPEVPLEGMH